MTLNEANLFLLDQTDTELCLIRKANGGFKFISRIGKSPKDLEYNNEQDIRMDDLIKAINEYKKFKKEELLPE